MDENTQFLIERIDKVEERLLRKLDDLQAFKNKLLGMALLAGGIGSAIVDVVIRHA